MTKIRNRVGVMLLNEAKTEVVLVKHKGIFPEVPMFYTLPGGGVEVGESLADAAKREAFEECGFVVEIEGLWVLYDFIREPIHSLNHYFIGKMLSGSLYLDHQSGIEGNEMIHSVGFYAIADLHQLDAPIYPVFLQEKLHQYKTDGAFKTEYMGVFTEIL